MDADVIMVIGANPTEGHPVFASQMKRRLRQGRAADRASTRARSGSCVRRTSQADYHLPLRPGTNVPMINALAHVIVEEKVCSTTTTYSERCDMRLVPRAWREFASPNRELRRSHGG